MGRDLESVSAEVVCHDILIMSEGLRDFLRSGRKSQNLDRESKLKGAVRGSQI